MARILARTLSFSVQSIVMFLRTVSSSSSAIFFSVSSPRDLNCAVVRFERIVKGQLLFCESEFLAALVRVAHIPS